MKSLSVAIKSSLTVLVFSVTLRCSKFLTLKLMSTGNHEDGGYGAFDEGTMDLGGGVDPGELEEGGDTDYDLRDTELAIEPSMEMIRALAAHDAALYDEGPALRKRDPDEEERIKTQIARRAERLIDLELADDEVD